MSKKQSRDLFDESTMTFGEHLEELRIRLWRAIVGLFLVTGVTMYYGDSVMAIVRKPIEDALKLRGAGGSLSEEMSKKLDVSKLWAWVTGKAPAEPAEPTVVTDKDPVDRRAITVQIEVNDLLTALHAADPDHFPAPKIVAPPDKGDEKSKATDDGSVPAKVESKSVSLKLRAPEFEQIQQAVEQQSKPVVLTVQEAFMTWLKVSFVAGLMLSSPWVFYQLWLFVAAGLYPHEQKYVHIYLPMSTALFLGGASFCFFCVFPFVLDFLLGFSYQLDLQPQIRLADWINFAIMLPVMFGISFQLPLVMLFLERLSIFEVTDYREKRRIAIFVITIISMLLTPAEPYSMLMMMIPLIVLYEFGIMICVWFPKPKPFDDDEKTSIATA